ncbi:SNF2-related protein [Pseudomonas viridiflava]|uniref:SNF2-related protein n=1 Tax=Pseudomonas viridiflava TaxID=33069 RepID=UPI001F1488A9|nr:SNF2-related protein [Pseudomonas viridiflava]
MQRSLFDDIHSPFEGNLPDASRMPLNAKGRTVHSSIIKDLCNPGDVLMVTGYSGLDQLVRLITARASAPTPLRVLLGSEPMITPSSHYSLKRYDFSDEIREYWLKRGISLALGAQVVRCIELVRAGHVRIRYPIGTDRMHAKIYCSPTGVTLGSSNYTYPGLFKQREANVRFTPSDKFWFQHGWQVAECYWSQSRDASAEFVALLERLLKFVTWREALARACAELLESEWASHYLESLTEVDPVQLWPAQRQGIGQALYLIETLGAVLVADATGSGKTRLGAHLLRAIRDQNWSSSRSRKSSTLLICPPLVQKHWEREIAKCGASVSIESQGILSRLTKDDESTLTIQLATAQTLAVDEAHNFLSQTSKRTLHLKHNLADQVVLFTATPINRSRRDLLRLIDILGADNFDDQTLAVLDLLNRKSTGLGSAEDLEVLQAAIGSFTVRRTKTQFNAEVMRDPDAYKLPSGHICRYPPQKSAIYGMSEFDEDCAYAGQIRERCRQLKGVSYFRKPLVLPQSWNYHDISPELYLDIRLRAANSLGLYHVMSSLRSSRLALYRHLVGEAAAWKRLGISMPMERGGDDDTGNMLERLEELKGQCPENRLGIELPAWLTDPDEHRKACEQEREIYFEIGSLLDKISGHREEQKVRHLMKLFDEHRQVLAFDHYPLTLRYLIHLWGILNPHANGIEVILGVGGNRRAQEQIQAKLDPATSSSARLLVMCSDALSEGVNLQGASTLTHLDMPSVVRVAEQRVGRIDRMNSRHEQIETWWPKDAPEFALRSDEVFVFRVEEADSLIGGNLQLPEELRSPQQSRIITPESMEEEMLRRAEQSWDGIEDAFAPIRALVTGSDAVIPAEIYELYRKETAKVLSRVSVVNASEPWVFICLAGDRAGAPRWILLTRNGAQPVTELREIVKLLRARLPDDIQTLEPTRAAMGELQSFLARLSEIDRQLLPKRKQRALEQMRWAIDLWLRHRQWEMSTEQCDQIKRLHDVISGAVEELSPDWGSIADRWIDLVKPRWVGLLQGKARKASLKRLKDLEPSLRKNPVEVEILLKKMEGVLFHRHWDERIVACILGYGAADSTQR